jgi:type I restriction enzyme S subunit
VTRPWTARRLGELVSLTSGQSPSGFRFGSSGTPYFKVEQLGKSSKYLDRDATPYLSAKVPSVPAGSVLIAKRGAAIALNRVRILREPGFMDTNVMALTPGAEIDSEFLYHWLSHRGLWDIADITSVPQINNKHIVPLEIALPDIAEQRAIVAALGGNDDAAAALERLIAKRRGIRQGLLQALLTGRTRLAGFTEPWTPVRLGDHVRYIRNAALSRAQLDVSSPLRYLHYGDIHTRTSPLLDASAEVMPRAPRELAGTAGLLAIGDLVFADASEDPDGVGRSVEITGVPAEGVIPGLHTITARFDKRVLADGFKAYLQNIGEFRRQLLALAAGTKVLATTRTYISGIELVLPGVAEQTAIAQVLRDADAEIGALERRLRSLRAVKQGMMQELLTGRTRLGGEAVP